MYCALIYVARNINSVYYFFMLKKIFLFFIATLVLVSVGIVGLLIYEDIINKEYKPISDSDQIVSFEECKSAGFAVVESDKTYCKTDKGKIFYEEKYKPQAGEYTSQRGTKIFITQPLSGDTITSPLAVKGRVPGNWSFEASFPISLLDSSGKTLAQLPAQLKGDWMTTNYVDFEATLTFGKQPAGSKGNLLLRKDNPSGLEENDDSVSLELMF